jgi:glycosyltransferase involved in cell wall biosynthesis
MRTIIAFKNPKAADPQACHVGLGVTAGNSAEVLVEHGIHADAVPVVDGYYLRDKLRNNAWPGLTHLVFCAPYVDTPFLDSLCREFAHIRFSVVFHSNVGFLQADRWAVKVMREQMDLERRTSNFNLAGNCEKFTSSVESAYGVPCALLPNLYFLHGPIERRRAAWSGPGLDICIFGATRILKNLMTAAWACIQIGRDLNADLRIHISTGREEGGAGVLQSVREMCQGLARVELVEEPWLPWLEFRRIIRRMHLMMQPSFTESFNGVTADGIAEGVPSVVSPAIDWVPAKWIANPDDAREIAETGKRLLRDRHAQRDGYRALVRHNERAMAAWRKFLARG